MGAAARVAQRPRRLALRAGLGGPARIVDAATPTDLSGAGIVQVAAAVILRADGRFLLAQRPPGKAYAGYWEFPGGKVERGEPLADALARELHEELGIEVTRAYQWIVQPYVYPHAHVQLNFFRVLGWSGEPHPREDQALAWAALHDLGVTPLLPANGPVLRALALPDRLGITHAHELGIEPFLQRLDAALAGGLRMVMVREKEMPGTRLAPFAREVVRRCHAAGAKALIHGDAQLAAACGADGVHFAARSLLQTTSRPQSGLCGASCHDAAELEQAQRLGLDYAVLGAVLPTASHPGQPAMGWERFAELTAGRAIPVYALGGMQPQHLERAWQAGAHGVAMMRAAWAA